MSYAIPGAAPIDPRDLDLAHDRALATPAADFAQQRLDLEELHLRCGDRLFVTDFDTPQPPFVPEDWYWRLNDGSLFSSARIARVSPSDPDYVLWAATGRSPTRFPADEAGAQTPAALQAVLEPRGLFASLGAYAAALRYRVEVAGVVVTLQGAPVTVSTTRENEPRLRAVLAAITAKTRRDGDVSKIFADGQPRALTNAEAKAFANAGLAHIQEAFNREGEVDTLIASGAIADKAGVEAAFAEPEA